MPIRRLAGVYLGSVGSTRLLSITSAETIYIISSGMRALDITNLGSYPVYYGGSGVRVSSGGLIQASSVRAWDHVVDDFTLYLAVQSGAVSSNIVVTEYEGG